MKPFLLLFLSALFAQSTVASPLAHSVALVAGQIGSGGGDSCEERFKAVAQDIEIWIKAGAPAGLKLPVGLTVSDYSTRMLREILSAHITCVGPHDTGYPVAVAGKAKECKNFVDNLGIPCIVCDRAKFYSSLKNPDNDPDQYKIVHHELASLARIEKPNGDDSNYAVSEQITGYLRDTVVQKLAIKKSEDTLCKEEIQTSKWLVDFADGQVSLGNEMLDDLIRAQLNYLATELHCTTVLLGDYCKEAVPLAQNVVNDELGLLVTGKADMQTAEAAKEQLFKIKELCQ